jgi:adhesin transport system membrane fusion protein
MPKRNHLVEATRSALPVAGKAQYDALPELTMPIGAGDSYSLHLLHATLIICSIIVISAIAWAGFANVSEVASITGSLQPMAKEQVVAQLDGGIVAQVFVREGDVVKAGQPIMAMDPTFAEGELLFARQRLAQINRRRTEVAILDSGLDAGKPNSKGAALRGAALDAERRSAAARMSQQSASLALLQTQLDTALKSEAFAQDDRDRAQRLFKADATTKSALNQREAAINEARGRVAMLRRQMDVARGVVSQIGQDTQGLLSRQALDLFTEGHDLALQQTEASVLLRRAEERMGRLVVRSAVSGVVKTIAYAKGAVVLPATNVAIIVPKDVLVVDGKVLARDRHGLQIGQSARLRVSGFELPGKGWIDAQVAMISPSSSLDEAGNRFYNLRMVIGGDAAKQVAQLQLAPGMEVRGDVITGHKTVLSYILSPVRKGLDTALTEK